MNGPFSANASLHSGNAYSSLHSPTFGKDEASNKSKRFQVLGFPYTIHLYKYQEATSKGYPNPLFPP